MLFVLLLSQPTRRAGAVAPRCHYDRGVSESVPSVAARFPPALRSAVDEQLTRAREARLGERLRAADATLWGPPGTPEVANRLGWLTIAQRMSGQLDDVRAFAAELAAEGFTDVVLLGMGGSSLAPEVLRRTFGHRHGHPRLHVLDSTDAATIRSVQARLGDPAHGGGRALFLVSSKSGGTIEPLSLFAHFFAVSAGGNSEEPSRFAAITDPGSGLQRLAAERGFRRTFPGDPDIGGRYSALSPFGIVPATLIGLDARALLAGAEQAWETPVKAGAVGGVPAAADREATLGAADRDAVLGAGAWLGATLSALAQAGRDKLTFLISRTLPGLGLWLEQLVAESTGKRGTGILPVAEEPPGEPAAYGDDRVFVHIPDLRAPDPELDAHAERLAAAGHPLISMPADGGEDLGRIFMLAEIAVAAAGWGLAINPFDQPNVQQAKDATNAVLAGFERSGSLPEVPDADPRSLRTLLLDAAPGEYVAMMAYVQPSDQFDAAAAELRAAVRAATRATTTFGYGPRFLHSTGQFHKGGPPTGRFLQLLHDGPADVEIPGKRYTFTTLKNAQATGDLQTLRELGRPAERVRLQGDDPVRALRALTATIKEQT
jgi:glucose-6-phosphate isomerase